MTISLNDLKPSLQMEWQDLKKEGEQLQKALLDEFSLKAYERSLLRECFEKWKYKKRNFVAKVQADINRIENKTPKPQRV